MKEWREIEEHEFDALLTGSLVTRVHRNVCAPMPGIDKTCDLYAVLEDGTAIGMLYSDINVCGNCGRSPDTFYYAYKEWP